MDTEKYFYIVNNKVHSKYIPAWQGQQLTFFLNIT